MVGRWQWGHRRCLTDRSRDESDFGSFGPAPMMLAYALTPLTEEPFPMRFIITAALLAAAAPAAAQTAHAGHDSTHASHAGHAGHAARSGGDSAFTALQGRGHAAMGVDQYTSTHTFDALPDGGSIRLVRDSADPAGVDQIRRHLREIAGSFAKGDFTTPAFVHDGPVPGTEAMARLKDRIRYTVQDLPLGAELRLTTSDPEALAAIRGFMAFQRGDHRAGGVDGHAAP